MRKDSRKIGDVINVKVRIEPAEQGCTGCAFFSGTDGCPYKNLRKVLGGGCGVNGESIIYKLVEED